MELSFSRGFSHGFFDGNNHKVLVRGDYAKKRGVFVGEVAAVVGVAGPARPGRAGQAGRRPGLRRRRSGRASPSRGGGSTRSPGSTVEARPGSPPVGPEGLSAGPAELGFGRRDLDVRQLRPGQRAWKTDDPELTRRLRQSFEGPPRRKVALDVTLRAVVGEPLRLTARASNGARAEAVAESPLVAAENRPATVGGPPGPVRPARRVDLRAGRVRGRDRGRAAGPPERAQRPPPRTGREA